MSSLWSVSLVSYSSVPEVRRAADVDAEYVGDDDVVAVVDSATEDARLRTRMTTSKADPGSTWRPDRCRRSRRPRDQGPRRPAAARWTASASRRGP